MSMSHSGKKNKKKVPQPSAGNNHWVPVEKKIIAIPNRAKANFQKRYNNTKNILMSYSFYKVIFTKLFLFSHLGQWEKLRNILPILQMRELRLRGWEWSGEISRWTASKCWRQDFRLSLGALFMTFLSKSWTFVSLLGANILLGT